MPWRNFELVSDYYETNNFFNQKTKCRWRLMRPNRRFQKRDVFKIRNSKFKILIILIFQINKSQLKKKYIYHFALNKVPLLRRSLSFVLSGYKLVTLSSTHSILISLGTRLLFSAVTKKVNHFSLSNFSSSLLTKTHRFQFWWHSVNWNYLNLQRSNLQKIEWKMGQIQYSEKYFDDTYEYRYYFGLFHYLSILG